jgi:hypothetical protein
MSLQDENMGVMPNPSQYYLEWNSKENAFCYYDKEEGIRKPMKLPFKFVALKFMSSVRGYDETFQGGIYSNEVSDTRTELLRVAYQKNNEEIATGLYAELKDMLRPIGGKYTRSIYAMSPKGLIINIRLKGEQMLNFKTIEMHGDRWKREWIQVSSSQEKEYNGQVYTLPVFEWGGPKTPGDSAKAEANYSIVKGYLASKTPVMRPSASQPYSVVREVVPVPDFLTSDGNDDDLPF